MFGWLSMKHGVVRRTLTASAAACLLATTLALGACGATTQAQQDTGATGGAASPTATNSIPGGGMAVRPCPGLVGDATQVGALALTLTQSVTTGSLHVGELAQVRLPAALHWTMIGQPDHLTSVGQAGGQDTTLNVCYWTYRADSVGSVTLHFSGTPPCDNPPSNPCSNAIIAQSFTITVS